MQTIDRKTPKAMGYKMPGEYERHDGCIMIWPVRPGSWTNKGLEAKEAFTRIANEISRSETVNMLCKSEYLEEVRNVFASNKNVNVMVLDTDDAWARDMMPTFVKDEAGKLLAIDWKFNAWGGEYDGLYADYEQDAKAAAKFCCLKGCDVVDTGSFVMEGGAVHSDGEGTLLVTEACLLSKGRNPELTKAEIEKTLLEYLGAEKVIWLPRGIVGDETNEHVDNACAFVKPGHVVLAWTDDENDIQWEASNEDLKVLEKETDAMGRHLVVHKLPIPKKPVCITKDELDALSFAEGEDMREVGERLAASYVNFYIANKSIILPVFGDDNDSVAIDILSELFPERNVFPVYARSIIVGGGNIHCITQQIPK